MCSLLRRSENGLLSFMKLPRILMIVFWSRPFDQDHWKCMYSDYLTTGCQRNKDSNSFTCLSILFQNFFCRSLSNQDEVMKSSLLNPICYCFLTALAHLAKIILTTEWMASQNGFMIHFSFVHVSFGCKRRMQIMLAHPVLLHKVSRIQILHSITKKPMTHFFCNLWITE